MTPNKRFFYMLALTAMWSPSFLFIKLAIEDLPPVTIVSLRVTLGALIIGGILFWKRLKLPSDWRFWLTTCIMSFFSSMFPFCLFCYAEQTIDSALAALLNGTTPMFTAILAQLFVASDRMNYQKGLGITLCLTGILLLFAPKLQSGVDGTLLGMIAALVAAFSYSISHVYAKLYLSGQKPFIAPAAQLIASSLMLWPLALTYDRCWELDWPPMKAMIGVCGLAFFGTVCAFIIYYKLLDYSGPTAISTVACFFPAVGMMLGFLFLNEAFTPLSMMAAIIILVGMLSVNEVISLDFFRFEKKSIAGPIEE